MTLACMIQQDVLHAIGAEIFTPWKPCAFRSSTSQKPQLSTAIGSWDSRHDLVARVMGRETRNVFARGKVRATAARAQKQGRTAGHLQQVPAGCLPRASIIGFPAIVPLWVVTVALIAQVILVDHHEPHFCR